MAYKNKGGNAVWMDDAVLNLIIDVNKLFAIIIVDQAIYI